MTGYCHITAPIQFVEANGIRYAYRRFGAETGTPLVFLQHFRGGLDNWDPLVTDGLAEDRPVILFNNAGVASSSGETPDTVDPMADHVAIFVKALDLPVVDVLGFSLGGFVAQSSPSAIPNSSGGSYWSAPAPVTEVKPEPEPAHHAGGWKPRTRAGGLPLPVLLSVGEEPGGRSSLLGAPAPARGSGSAVLT